MQFYFLKLGYAILEFFSYVKSIFTISTGGYLTQAIYAVLGGAFITIIPLYCKIFKQKEEDFMSTCVWHWILVFGIFYFIIDGVFLHGFLRRSITIKNKAFDSTEIKVEFGNFFNKAGWHVVAVNEFFDNAVDNLHVAEKSLHGQMIKKFWKNPDDWYKKILLKANLNPIESIIRDSPAKQDKFPIGTTSTVSSSSHQFICVVLSHTDIINLQASADVNDLLTALKAALQRARSVCAGHPVIFPIIGGSLSRTGINKNMLLNLLIMTIFEELKKGLITEKIRIILPYKEFSKYNLNSIKKDWN